MCSIERDAWRLEYAGDTYETQQYSSIALICKINEQIKINQETNLPVNA